MNQKIIVCLYVVVTTLLLSMAVTPPYNTGAVLRGILGLYFAFRTYQEFGKLKE